ncbi:MAG TPA: metalloregulator ArsR/SmtB family transcription factor [Solirubrobacteraceae bacterium]|jgi:DNA-binding transcriptional ArsR family regulator
MLKQYVSQGAPVDLPVDLLFQALSDPTRRLMVDRLSRGPASVSELAEPFDMSLPAIVQHLHVLEHSGLVCSQKVGRVRTCSIQTEAMRTAEQWISQRRAFWEKSLDRLGDYLAENPDQVEQRSKR